MKHSIALTLILLFYVPSQAQQRVFAAVANELAYFAANDFMGSVLIAEGEDIVFYQSTGMSSIAKESPLDETSVYRIASLTKQFTAAAILLLQERGQLSVNDSIGLYIDELPRRFHDITLQHLLTHSSGLSSEVPNSAFNSDANKQLEMSDAQWQQIQISSEPGARTQYSNSGFHLLAEVIESVSGVSYTRFIQEHILDPLQLASTGFVSMPNDSLVSGYVPQDQKLVEQALTAPEIEGAQAAGGMTSTASDLHKWNRSLFGGSLLTEGTVDRALSGSQGYSALGLQVMRENGRLRIFHTGSLFGHAASLSYLPDSGYTIVVLSNVNGRDSGGDAELLAKSIEYLLFDEEVLLPSHAIEIELPDAELERFVGSYEIEGQGGLSITRKEGILTLQFLGDSNRYPLSPVSEHTFIMGTPFIDYEFIEDDSGSISALLLHQRGSEFRFLRK